MKSKLIILLVIAAVISGQHLNAQVSSYSFSQNFGGYGISGQGNKIGSSNQDDEVNQLALPFTFTYNNTPYNSVYVCSNGYISFNPLNGFEYSALSDFQTTEVIAAFAQDLVMGTAIKADFTAGSNIITNCSSTLGISVGDTIFDINFDFGGNPVVTGFSGNDIVVNTAALNSAVNTDVFFSNGSIRESVSGTAPNRVFELEYKNFTRFFVYDEVMNFKIRLYETSNRIEYVYGFFSPGISTTGSEVGLKGASLADFNSREITSLTTWSTSSPAGLITDPCLYSPQNFPAAGLTFIWSPSVCVTPSIQVSQPSPAVCSGQSATITVSGAETYSWSTGSTASVQVVTPSATSTFTLFAFNGACSSSLAVTQSVVANPTITLVQSKSHICRGNTATLTASGAGSYTWSNGATTSVIVVSPTLTTTYSVSGANEGCQASKAIVQNVSSCTGLDESTIKSATMVYPNPFSDVLTVNCEAGNRITLTDALGNLVLLQEAETDGQQRLSTAELRAGMYILSVTGHSGSYSSKVVKR